MIMAVKTGTVALLLVLSLGLVFEIQADSDLLTDFFVPNSVNASELGGDFFTFTGLRNGLSGKSIDSAGFNLGVAFATQFPALTGLGVSLATLHIQPEGVIPLHFHSRGSEILFIIDGQLKVGFVDSTNKLFSQVLEAGDLFAIPEGMVHYYSNLDAKNEVKAIASLGSSEPGYTLIPKNLFSSGISDQVLEVSFGVPSSIVESLKAPHE